MYAKAKPVLASGDLGIKTIYGWNFAENAATAAAARVLLRDGGATGAVVADVRLAAGQSMGEAYPRPLLLDGPLYVEVSAGTVRGAVYGG